MSSDTNSDDEPGNSSEKNCHGIASSTEESEPDVPTNEHGIGAVAQAIHGAVHAYNDDESHREREDPSVFHPSSLGSCTRQMYLSKLDLKDSSEHLGKMHNGTIIHEWLEDHATEHIADAFGVPEGNVFPEVPAHYDAPNGVSIRGTADLYIPTENVVIDYKTRGGWYSFEPDDAGYITQLSAYARALDVINIGIVYINRKDAKDTRTYPEDHTWALRDDELLGEALSRCEDVKRAIEREGIATSEDEIPFEKCDRNDGDPCYFCSSEELDFSGL